MFCHLVRLGEAEVLYKEEHNTSKFRTLHLGKNNSTHLMPLERGSVYMCVSVCLEDFYLTVAQISKLAWLKASNFSDSSSYHPFPLFCSNSRLYLKQRSVCTVILQWWVHTPSAPELLLHRSKTSPPRIQNSSSTSLAGWCKPSLSKARTTFTHGWLFESLAITISASLTNLLESSCTEKGLGVLVDNEQSMSQHCVLETRKTTVVLGCIKKNGDRR